MSISTTAIWIMFLIAALFFLFNFEHIMFSLEKMYKSFVANSIGLLILLRQLYLSMSSQEEIEDT